ncbi:MAG: hypothetical protein K2O33_02565 [Muribaculaceae bacterium]|nr:hypothetical protein [Muribaculaceae bacterium]
MNVPFVTWCVIVFAVIAIVAGRALRHVWLDQRKAGRRMPLFGMGQEREEFFVPGDKPVYSKDDYDDPYDD